MQEKPSSIGVRHPPPVIILPIFRCLPLFVNGIPVAREIFVLNLVMPVARFQENPPLFMDSSYKIYAGFSERISPAKVPPEPKAVVGATRVSHPPPAFGRLWVGYPIIFPA